jgi:hypothetical protein
MLEQNFEHARIEPSPCPHCQHKLDSAYSPSNPQAKPRPGDLTVCINCQEFLQFDNDLKVIKVTDELRAKIEQESPGTYKELQRIRMAIKMIKEEKK